MVIIIIKNAPGERLGLQHTLVNSGLHAFQATAPALPVRFRGQRSPIVAAAAAPAAAPRTDDVSGIAASDSESSGSESQSH